MYALWAHEETRLFDIQFFLFLNTNSIKKYLFEIRICTKTRYFAFPNNVLDVFVFFTNSVLVLKCEKEYKTHLTSKYNTYPEASLCLPVTVGPCPSSWICVFVG